MRFNNHTEWCEQLEPGDCVMSDEDIVEVERNATGYIVVANETDEEKRYREYDSLSPLLADSFDYEHLSNSDADIIDMTFAEETPPSLDYLQRSLRHKHALELPDAVKPTANPEYYTQLTNLYRHPSLNLIEAMFSYPVVIAAEGNSLMTPTDVGTGFFLAYKGKHIFITADHVIHDDYAPGDKVRHGLDNLAAIFTGRILEHPDGSQEGELFQLGGFYYFEKFDVLAERPDPELFDAAFTFIGEQQYQQLVSPTAGVTNDQGQIIVPRGICRKEIKAEHIVKPNAKDKYFVAGQVQYHWQDSSRGAKVLASFYIQHPEMRFSHTEGNYTVLVSPEKIVKKEWKNLSGSPVLNQEGALVGVLCSGKVGTNKVYIISIHSILGFIDKTFQIEEINKKTTMEYNITIDEIYAALPADDASRLRALVEQYGEEKAAEEWINTLPEDQIPLTQFSGGIGDEEDLTFAQAIRREIDYFICGHPKYADLRKQAQSKGTTATFYVGATVAAALGSVFGVTTAAILPTVLLLFHVAGKITLNAYCRNYNFKEEEA